jgi:hypothetical protein
VQFKVPQNIDMADRIVGPLTLIQFLYLMVGGIIIYFLLNTVAPINNVLFMAMSLPIGLASLALAFLKVQDQPLPRFVASFFVYVFKPKERVWVKDASPNSVMIVPDPPKANETVSHKSVRRSQLEQLAQTLDRGGNVAPLAGVAQQPARQTSGAVPPPNYLRRGRPVLDNVKNR